MSDFILGLDLGTNSIGWATIGCDENANPTHLLDANSRIFLAMVEADTKVPKNKQRRDKRLARRQVKRYKERRDKLLEILIAHHLLPGEFQQPADWVQVLTKVGNLPDGDLKTFLASNPFLLRAESLQRNLTAYEFGRVLMHLVKRRGYKSNRGIKYHALFDYLRENNIDFQDAALEDIEPPDASENTNQHADKKEAEETGKVLGGIRVLKEQMRQNETIGQFVVRLAQEEEWETPHRLHTISKDETRPITRGRNKGTEKTTHYNLHATRALYEEEFSRIWESQADNLCNLLNQTPEQVKILREQVKHAIFDQLPLQLQKGKVGMCSIRLKKKRAATALLESQEYLLLADINHLKYGEYERGRRRVQTPPKQTLSPEQHQQLLDALSDPSQMDERDRLTWDKVREILRLDDSIKFNAEISSNKDKSGEQIKSSKQGITGNRTALAIARVIPNEWKSFTDAQKKALVNDLLNIHDKQNKKGALRLEDNGKVALFNRLRNSYRLNDEKLRYQDTALALAQKNSTLKGKKGTKARRKLKNPYREPNPWQFSDLQAFELATLELPSGYMGHCHEVIVELLKHLKQGMVYSDAKEKAEFSNRSQLAQPQYLEAPPNIANPIVQKALYETRRVVNALIERYGAKPKIIRIEMARDMKASKAHRAEMEKRNRENQNINEKAKEAIRDWNLHHPHQTIGLEYASVEKIKLWIEQRVRPDKESTTKIKLWQEQNHYCLYSGKPITFPQIADGDVEIDHIYPLSLSGMDDYLNKVLVFKSFNLAKEQKTPWQKWGESERYEQIVRDAQKYYGGDGSPLKAKLDKIRDKSDKDTFREKMAEFTKAQLNDTRYICVAVKNYLKTLGYTDREIQVSRGRATAEIRRLWGLGNILPKSRNEQEESSNAHTETQDEVGDEQKKKGKKKDRGDHRHHAIDAIIIALTDENIFKKLQDRYRYYELHGSWPEADLEKPRRADGKPWESLRHDVKQVIMNRVVSFSANRKVSGGLHDEQPYGLGCYEDEMPLKNLIKKPEIIRALPDKTPGKQLTDSDEWIADPTLRQMLQEWLASRERAKSVKNFPLPMLANGAPLNTVTIAHRCYVKRASVVEALKLIENKPGKKRWVADNELRKILQEWLKKSGNSIKSAEANPPLTPSKNSKGNPIRTVRLASISSSMTQFNNKPQIFAKASNHHVAIFKRVLNGEIVERRGVFVDMLAAAKRIRKPPVVRKSPQELLEDDKTINPAEWQFEMSLCNNDMVLWDKDDPDWQAKAHDNLGRPIYRLQKMSGADNSVYFRHFSVTSTDGKDRRGLIQTKAHLIRCKKIRMDNLGNYSICND